jgi:LysR family glycine cleavage system transcriptional activator
MNATPRVSLHLIRGFWFAARHLSFTRAAAELYVTQSAISREIKKLEEQLGQPLFRRVNRTLQLTQAGEELYRAVDEALALIDAATDRLAGAQRYLTVTTTVPLASLWLVPRLPRFTQHHPDIDVRIVASNDVLDLVQAHMDIAIRYVSPGGTNSPGKPLVGYSTFPVCTPALMRDPARPLRTVADLAHHVLLEFETTVHGRPWYDWDQWFNVKKIAKFKPAGRQRFSHYDQVVEAALAGSGVAIGKRPHLNSKLLDGTLCAPFGTDGVASLASFHVVTADSATGRGAVGDAFVAWLRNEVRRDERAMTRKQD